MISKDPRCVFVHIPKTAGQSIEHFFLTLNGLSWEQRAPLLLKYNSDPERGPERLAHLKASEYIENGYLTQDEFSNHFKFAFVRNPWDRILSEYKYRKHDARFSFRDYIFNRLPQESNYTDTHRHIIPQYDYIHDSSGRLMVDFVGRFEQLQGDFDTVCQKLGIVDSILPHANRSKSKHGIRSRFKKMFSLKTRPRIHYSSYYDSETRERVTEMYQKDISTFEYEFSEESEA